MIHIETRRVWLVLHVAWHEDDYGNHHATRFGFTRRHAESRCWAVAL